MWQLQEHSTTCESSAGEVWSISMGVAGAERRWEGRGGGPERPGAGELTDGEGNGGGEGEGVDFGCVDGDEEIEDEEVMPRFLVLSLTQLLEESDGRQELSLSSCSSEAR